jgi:phosphatidylcholine synthase
MTSDGPATKPSFRRSHPPNGETIIRPVRWWQRGLGWCVHCYTALGLVAAAAIAALIVQGEPESYRRAFLLMIAATLIDATDGTFARRVRIKEVVPGFDGRRLDDIVDFLTYTSLPLLLIWRAHLLPEGWEAALLLPLLASAYGFCQVSAKTDDGYFLGFPSYWNLVAFYLYTLRPLPGWLSVGGVVLLAVLTFVPSRYLYPSQRGRLNQITVLLGAAWAVLLVLILWNMPVAGGETTRSLAALSLFFPAWYMGVSWFISVRFWRGERRRMRAAMS